MVTMPKDRIHEQHDAMPGVSMLHYLSSNSLSHGVPVPEGFTGTVKAELHWGRWIVRCPADDCAGAVLVTSEDPKSYCPDCGAGWFQVEFPKDLTAIETEVMKRRTTRLGMPHANWDPYGGRDKQGRPNGKGETLAQLRRQTIEAEGG